MTVIGPEVQGMIICGSYSITWHEMWKYKPALKITFSSFFKKCLLAKQGNYSDLIFKFMNGSFKSRDNIVLRKLFIYAR